VYSLEPKTLLEVAESFVKLSSLCGVVDRGIKLKNDFISNDSIDSFHRPRVFLLEWIDPPYDGGHWIPDMIEMAGCTVVRPSILSTHKSKQICWDDIYASDPDVVLVACCGFGLQRNIADAIAASDKLCKLRTTTNIYAVDGDAYFVRPGPKLLGGISMVTRCAFDDNEHISKSIDELDFTPKRGIGWEKISFSTLKANNKKHEENSKQQTLSTSTQCDIEDLPTSCSNKDFTAAHDMACEDGQMMYSDPQTGYKVFTKLAHKKRGKCCGSGCRHCPYNHINVKDKANRIKEPAFLYDGDISMAENNFSTHIDKIYRNEKAKVKILFNSGGKDSFLTMRALSKQFRDGEVFSIILMTSFDAQSRTIAHQETHINLVIKQAEHLKIPLVGIPLHRASNESYVQRAKRSIELISTRIGGAHKIASLVFGDLHLDHIRDWRDSNIGPLGYHLEYPLWKVPYASLLKDLKKSGVSCRISALTVDGNPVKIGDVFDEKLCEIFQAKDMDGFGENGEFHSMAEVWVVKRNQALSFDN